MDIGLDFLKKSLRFRWALLESLRDHYTRQLLLKDITAGVVVGIVAVPLAIAFGIASNVTPEQGLYTAIVAGFVAALFSGSRVQVGGPTGAFVILIGSVVTQFGYSGLAVATVMAGGILVLMGITKIGSVVKFIPFPVIMGFTTGIGIVIFSLQIPDLLGLTTKDSSSSFVGHWLFYFKSLSDSNLWSVGLAIGTVAFILIAPRLRIKLIPGSLIAIVFFTFLTWALKLPVATIETKFHEVSSHFPVLYWPDFSPDLMRKVFPHALSIALLAGIESLLSAIVADGMTGKTHDSNMELIGQGMANLVCPFFFGIPATGAVARTVTNIKNGAHSPISSMVHALFLLLVMLLLGKLVALIPLSVLSGILLVVSWNMCDFHKFFRMFRAPKSDLAVQFITFGLTVFVDLTTAIQVGVVMAALLFMRRMAEVTEGVQVNLAGEASDNLFGNSEENSFPGIEIYEINGPFFFAAANKFKDTLLNTFKKPKVLILQMSKVNAIDATGIFTLEEIYYECTASGISLLLVQLQPQPKKSLMKSKLYDQIGDRNIFRNLYDSIRRGKEIIAQAT